MCRTYGKFLLKEKLPVPSPDAIPQLLSRLGTDAPFRADVASLMRATLYEEREGIGYEDLLGILVVATAGTENDLKSDSQEADLRALLRFLLQSRRSTFPTEPKPEETRIPVGAGPRESVPVRPARVNSEPMLHTRGTRTAARSMKLELRSDEAAVAVVEADSRGQAVVSGRCGAATVPYVRIVCRADRVRSSAVEESLGLDRWHDLHPAGSWLRCSISSCRFCRGDAHRADAHCEACSGHFFE